MSPSEQTQHHRHSPAAEDATGDVSEIDHEARRRRALHAGLVVLFLLMIVGSLNFLWGGKAARSNHESQLTSGAASGTGSASSHPSRAAVVHTGNPCPTQQSCTVAGDAGVVAALNLYRVGHGRAAVSGSDSTNAQLCALKSGSAATCVPHYVWTSVPTQDAEQAVRSIANFAGAWLLDPTTSRVEVGWAWNGKSWECALLKYP